MAGLVPCSHPLCPTLTRGGPCARHARPQRASGWASHGAPRLRGEALQRKREALFRREPLCRACAALGRVTEAVIRDHIVPLAEGGTDTDDNIQPLCRTCSDAKTRDEAARGRARATTRTRATG